MTEFDPNSLLVDGVIGAVLVWFIMPLEKFLERNRLALARPINWSSLCGVVLPK